MTVDRSDWQCCLPVDGGGSCNLPLVYGSHEGPCRHEHEYGDDGICLDCGAPRDHDPNVM
jgi:hypothetical protein